MPASPAHHTTNSELADIRARAEAAARGPWTIRQGAGYAEITDNSPEFAFGTSVIATVGMADDSDGANQRLEANAAFIAHARQDVPALLAEIDDLNRELAGRDKAARKRWIKRQEQELSVRSMEFREGRWEMDLAGAREMAAAYTAMARTLLGDAPIYTETKLYFDVKIAESPQSPSENLVMRRVGG